MDQRSLFTIVPFPTHTGDGLEIDPMCFVPRLPSLSLPDLFGMDLMVSIFTNHYVFSSFLLNKSSFLGEEYCRNTQTVLALTTSCTYVSVFVSTPGTDAKISLLLPRQVISWCFPEATIPFAMRPASLITGLSFTLVSIPFLSSWS